MLSLVVIGCSVFMCMNSRAHNDISGNPLDKRLSKFAHIRYITEHFQIAMHIECWPISISASVLACAHFGIAIVQRAKKNEETEWMSDFLRLGVCASFELSAATVEIEYGKQQAVCIFTDFCVLCGSLACFFFVACCFLLTPLHCLPPVLWHCEYVACRRWNGDTEIC